MSRIEYQTDINAQVEKESITLTALLAEPRDRWDILVTDALEVLQKRHPDLTININTLFFHMGVEDKFVALSKIHWKKKFLSILFLLIRFGLQILLKRVYCLILLIELKMGKAFGLVPS